ncbi:protein kinase [Peterkaempfera sp. SMS 1(5)a]|uniref:serine/threonine-protein kinase n=1 Tax=Peterkaempfera podocarpi TaxID=3232308 RepID=UPI00367342EA
MGDTLRTVGGRYTLRASLGRGGMGTVWRADDVLLDRQVAVKEVHLRETGDGGGAEVQRERTLREARAAAQIRHPSVVGVHDVVEQDGRLWIVMELVDGRSLADVIAADGPLDPREAARTGLAVLDALGAAHGRGVLHRDVKPANVLLERGTGRVVLTDFGIARLDGSATLTEVGSFLGSPEFTAPERVEGGAAGPASDLWSLGVLLCAALAGRSPFQRDSMAAILHAVMFEEISLPESARPLAPAVEGLLRRDPAERATAAETARRLREFLADAGTATQTARLASGRAGRTSPQDAAALVGSAAVPEEVAAAGPDTAPPQRRGRPRLLVAGVLLVAAAVGAGVIVALLPGQQERPGASTAPHSSAPASAPRVSTHPALTPSSSASLASAAPPGYTLVHDPLGFSLDVPDGWTRSLEPPRVFYYSPGRVFRLGIRIGARTAAGPMADLGAQAARGPKDYPGYHDGTVGETVMHGGTAALWQFTWAGDGGGTRRSRDLSWVEHGHTYDLWISAPLERDQEAWKHFQTAQSSFRP